MCYKGHQAKAYSSASDIEKPLSVNQGGKEVTEWMEVGNGCICCSVKYKTSPTIISRMIALTICDEETPAFRPSNP